MRFIKGDSLKDVVDRFHQAAEASSINAEGFFSDFSGICPAWGIF